MSQFWTLMTPEERLEAVTDYLHDKDTNMAEVVALLADKLKMRPVFVKSQGEAFIAKNLEKTAMNKTTPWSPMLFIRAWFFNRHKDLMATFLDATGVPHEDCQISENQAAPSGEACRKGAEALKTKGASDHLARVYFSALAEQDPEFWKALTVDGAVL